MLDPAALDQIERRLVWIFGSPRSGSTWLLRLLAHPWGVGRTPTGIDPSRFRPRGPDVVPVNESYAPLHLGPLREPLPDASGAAAAKLLLNDRRAGDPAYLFSDAYREAWQPAARALLLERFGSQAAAAAQAHALNDPLIVIKEPNGSHAAELIAQLLPACRIVFLLRDGRDVIDSMLDADGPGGWRTRTEGVAPVASETERLAAIDRQARLWLVRTIAVERACALLGPERTRVVRYEDLLADTAGELAALDAWLGIGRSAGQIAAAVKGHRFGSIRNRVRGRRKGVRAASPGLWRRNLTPAEQSLMTRLLSAKLRELGYGP